MSFLRILLVFTYFSTLPCLFLSIYSGNLGVWLGLTLTAFGVFLVIAGFYFRFRFKLKLERLKYEEVPFLFEEVRRYAYLSGLPLPTLWITRKPHLNAGVFGYYRGDRHFFFTEGVLKQFSNAELSALAAALMARHYYPITSLHSYTVALLYPFSGLLSKKSKSFFELASQYFLFSFLYVPLRLLKPKDSQTTIDKKVLSLYPHPFVYGKILRSLSQEKAMKTPMEAALGMISDSPFSFFVEDEVSWLKRIHWVESTIYG